MGIEPTLDLIGPTTALKTAGNTSHQSPPHSTIAAYGLMEHHNTRPAKCKFLLAICSI